MLNNINPYKIYLVGTPQEISFESFADDKGFSVSIFDKLFSSDKSSKKNRNFILTQEEMKKAFDTLVQSYRLFLQQLYIQQVKETAIEKGIQLVKSDLQKSVDVERQKLDNKIFEIKRRFGKNNTKKKIKKAEDRTDEIYSSGKLRAWDIATTARNMAYTSSIPEILNYSTYNISKLINNGREEFNLVLKDLENERKDL